MMPKEKKAQELVDKFKPYMYPFGTGSAYLTGDREGNTVVKDAKECAIICVEEKISEFKEMENNIAGIVFTSTIEYWQSVKEAIKKIN